MPAEKNNHTNRVKVAYFRHTFHTVFYATLSPVYATFPKNFHSCLFSMEFSKYELGPFVFFSGANPQMGKRPYSAKMYEFIVLEKHPATLQEVEGTVPLLSIQVLLPFWHPSTNPPLHKVWCGKAECARCTVPRMLQSQGGRRSSEGFPFPQKKTEKKVA